MGIEKHAKFTIFARLAMITITGTYYKGKLTLDKPIKTQKPVRVIVSIEENDSEFLSLSDFSFEETQEMLKDIQTSFSEEVVDERRKAI